MAKRPRSEPGIWTRKDYGIRNLGSLLDSSGRSSLTMWRAGVIAAACVGLLGLVPLWTGHATLPAGRHGRGVPLVGTDARVFGIALLAVAAFVHFHFFWGAHRKLEEHQAIGKIAALLAFTAAIAFVLYRQFV